MINTTMIAMMSKSKKVMGYCLLQSANSSAFRNMTVVANKLAANPTVSTAGFVEISLTSVRGDEWSCSRLKRARFTTRVLQRTQNDQNATPTYDGSVAKYPPRASRIVAPVAVIMMVNKMTSLNAVCAANATSGVRIRGATAASAARTSSTIPKVIAWVTRNRSTIMTNVKCRRSPKSILWSTELRSSTILVALQNFPLRVIPAVCASEIKPPRQQHWKPLTREYCLTARLSKRSRPGCLTLDQCSDIVLFACNLGCPQT
jgi:hypothetical protein